MSGKGGKLRASRQEVRKTVNAMLCTGLLEAIELTDAERKTNGIPRQVMQILKLKPA
jgi:hypothetical protein